MGEPNPRLDSQAQKVLNYTSVNMPALATIDVDVDVDVAGDVDVDVHVSVSVSVRLFAKG